MRQSGQPAFTLIELLVVITIVVVLLAMLTPALDRAMEQAVRLSCQARMRGLNIGVMQYAIDQKRWLPEWLDANVGVSSFWWYRLHANQYVRDRVFDGLLAPGPKSYSSPFVCPEKATNAEAWNTAFEPEWLAYNIMLGFANANSASGIWGQYMHVKYTRVAQPHETFMFMDGHRYSKNHPNADISRVRGDYVLSLNLPVDVGYGNMSKHGGGANYVMVDGHTEYLPVEDGRERADQGETGTPYRTEHFFLPFANDRIRK